MCVIKLIGDIAWTHHVNIVKKHSIDYRINFMIHNRKVNYETLKVLLTMNYKNTDIADITEL